MASRVRALLLALALASLTTAPLKAQGQTWSPTGWVRTEEFTLTINPGTVTSVDCVSDNLTLLTITGCPITSADTIHLTFPPYGAHKFVAGPTSGADATPTPRLIDVSDFTQAIPTPNYTLGVDTAGAYAWKDMRSPIGRTIFEIHSEMCYNSNPQLDQGGIVASIGGTGASSKLTGEITHPCISRCETGASQGRCDFYSANNLDAVSLGGGGGIWYGEMEVRVDTLSTGSHRYYLFMGFADAAATEAVDGVYIRYIDTLNSGRPQGVAHAFSDGTLGASSNETSCDTGWLESTLTTFHVYRVVVNAAGTLASFYRDDVFGCSVASNIPTGAGRETTFMPMGVYGTAGTVAKPAIDYYKYWLELATPR